MKSTLPTHVTGTAIGGPKDGQTLSLGRPASDRTGQWTRNLAIDVRRDDDGDPLFVDRYEHDPDQGILRYVNTIDLELELEVMGAK
jgi:hypothetical protein